MATYSYPYPANTANRSAHWIAYEGRDLLMYFTPRNDPNPVFDRFIGYLDVDWNAVNASAYIAPSGNVAPAPVVPASVAPAPVPASVESAPVVSAPVVTAPLTQTEVREGDDLVIYYPNGQVDRYPGYFAPSAGTVSATADSVAGIPPNTTPGGFVKPVSADVQLGNDRLVTFNDGTEKILSNFFLPHVPNNEAENNGAYIFGTGTTDPEYLKKFGLFPAKKFLVQDRQDGTDRVAVYSDGSSKRLPGWFAENEDLLVPGDILDPVSFGSNTPQSTYTAPDLYFVPPIFQGANPEYTTPATTATGVPASNVTMPPNLSSSGTGPFGGGTNTIIGAPSGLAPTLPPPGSTVLVTPPNGTQPFLVSGSSLILALGLVFLLR